MTITTTTALSFLRSPLESAHVFIVSADSSTECLVAKNEEEMSSWKVSILDEIRNWLNNNPDDEGS